MTEMQLMKNEKKNKSKRISNLTKRIESRRGQPHHRRCRHPHAKFGPNFDVWSRRFSLRETLNISLESKGPEHHHHRHLRHR